MHEGAIVRSLFNIVESYRSKAELKEVHKVKAVIGELHQVVDEFMSMYFDFMKAEIEGFENAVLEIEKRYPVLRCDNCKETDILKEAVFTCSKCNSGRTEIIQGNELYVDSIEGC